MPIQWTETKGEGLTGEEGAGGESGMRAVAGTFLCAGWRCPRTRQSTVSLPEATGARLASSVAGGTRGSEEGEVAVELDPAAAMQWLRVSGRGSSARGS